MKWRKAADLRLFGIGRRGWDPLGAEHHVSDGQDNSDHHDRGPHQISQWARGLHLQQSPQLIQQ